MEFEVTDELLERFWSKVDKTEGCWTWTAGLRSGRYGTIGIEGRGYAAHRLSYFFEYNTDPKDLLVCHTCDTPICVNPSHLFLGTQDDNMRDMKSKGRANKPIGVSNGRAKLTEDQVLEIRDRHSKGETNKSGLGREYDISHVTVTNILNRKLWKHI